MTYSITTFGNDTTPNLGDLDITIATVSNAAPIACAVSGANALTLTPNAGGQMPSSPLTAYVNGMLFSGIAAQTNTGDTTANVGAISNLTVFVDTVAGPANCGGGEIIAGCAFTLRYDSALASGNGGFHLTSSTQNVHQPVTIGGGTIDSLYGGVAALTFTVVPANTTQDHTFTVTGSRVPAVGKAMGVSPPSLAVSGLVFYGQVVAMGSVSSVASTSTLNIRAANVTAGSLTPPSGNYQYFVMGVSSP